MGCQPSKSLSPTHKKHDINDNATSRQWETSNPFSPAYGARKSDKERDASQREIGTQGGLRQGNGGGAKREEVDPGGRKGSEYEKFLLQHF